MNNIETLLSTLLESAEKLVYQNREIKLDQEIKTTIDEIITHCEKSKGVMTVVLTSIIYKLSYPNQDIRKHQSSIPNGYSGRSFDSNYITPFLKRNRFPAMSESGWLTRSLEQKVPYDKNYTGAIKPESLKNAFIRVIDYIQHLELDVVKDIAIYLLYGLVKHRELCEIKLAKPSNLSIKQILELLELHFSYKYSSDGASRLPVLALYAVYQILIKELKRFESCRLLPLEKHNSADSQSGHLADIDIVDDLRNALEAVEIKHNIRITPNILEIAYNKVAHTKIKRYYILTTNPKESEDREQIDQRIADIKNIHGCQIIVNGVQTTLKYYLRLVEDTSIFLENYTKLLSSDSSIKYEHKTIWNKLVTQILR